MSFRYSGRLIIGMAIIIYCQQDLIAQGGSKTKRVGIENYKPVLYSRSFSAAPEQKKLLEEANELYIKAGKRLPGESAKIQVRLGFNYLNLDELKKSQSCFDIGLKDSAEKSTAQLGLAIIQLQKGKLDEALFLINKVIQLGKKTPLVFAIEGEIYLLKGDYKAAANSFQKSREHLGRVKRVFPSPPDQTFRKMWDKENSYPVLGRGYSLIAAKESQEGVNLLTQLIQWDDKIPAFYAIRAIGYIQLGDHESASKDLLKFNRLNKR